MTIKTYNIKLIGEQTFKEHWVLLLKHTMDAYNACANIIHNNKVPLTIVAVHANCYDSLRQEFPYLPAQAIIRIQKEVLRAYRSQKSNKHKNGNVPQKYNLSMTLDKRMYSSFTCEGISLVSDILTIFFFISHNLFFLYHKDNALFQIIQYI